MSDPAAFFALLSFFASLGAIGFTSRSIGRLAEQYTDFVQTHITGLRSEVNKKGKDQAKMIEFVLQELNSSVKAGKQMQEEINQLKQMLMEAKTRIGYAEEEMNARMPPRRTPKAVLRAIPQ